MDDRTACLLYIVIEPEGSTPQIQLPRYAYLTTIEEYGPELETTENLLAIYATVEDAHRAIRLASNEEDSDFENWEGGGGGDHGVIILHGYDGKGSGVRLMLRRPALNPLGLVVPYKYFSRFAPGSVGPLKSLIFTSFYSLAATSRDVIKSLQSEIPSSNTKH